MAKKNGLDDLIQNLQDLNQEMKVDDVLKAALSEPQPTEDRLQQIEQALETFQRLGLFNGDDPRNLHILSTLGRTYERLNHYEKAFETYKQALALAQQHKEEDVRAELLSSIGSVLGKWQRWDEALDYLDQSQKAYGALGDVLGQAQTLRRRGAIFGRQGDYAGAQEAFETALEVGKKAEDQSLIAAVSNNLAVLATIRGDLDEAVVQYESCLEMYEALGKEQGLAGACHNLGMTHADRKDWGAAMDCFERGFEIAQKIGDLTLMANIHLHMAEVLLAMGNTMMVPMCCARALDIYRKLSNRSGEADAYRLLGLTFSMRKDWATAAGLFADSIRLNEELNDPLGLAESYRDLGKMHVARGHKQDAKTAFSEALAGFKKIGAQADIAEVESLLET